MEMTPGWSSACAWPPTRWRLAADLAIPAAAKGLVLFVHGSGSGRLSAPRNRLVAAKLQQAGLATLLLDLLTAEEETAERAGGRLSRFDVQLLAGRLVARWTGWLPSGGSGGLPVGLFGGSTGAGAALLMAADRPAAVAAVVSRGGRYDWAGAVLGRVRAPTLLVVGARPDRVGAQSGRPGRAGRPGPGWRSWPAPATCSPEPGALERVAELAVRLVPRHLAGESRLRAGHLLGPADHPAQRGLAL